MVRPRVTSEPRILTTYSCDSIPSSSWIRTRGITIPSSPAIWRRTMLTRRSSDCPPEPPSTSGTRPKPIASEAGEQADDQARSRDRQRTTVAHRGEHLVCGSSLSPDAPQRALRLGYLGEPPRESSPRADLRGARAR